MGMLLKIFFPAMVVGIMMVTATLDTPLLFAWGEKSKAQIETDKNTQESQKLWNLRIERDKARIGETKTVGGIVFMYIPADCNIMGDDTGNGDERPAHRSCAEGFWMAKFETTQGQYEEIAGINPSRFRDYDSRPVEQVSWPEAVAFAKKFSEKFGVTANLPTETQWEYAARAGTVAKYYWGDNPVDACSYANIADISLNANQEYKNLSSIKCDDGYAETAPVGSFKPNRFGLHDMIGNVDEWCFDRYVFQAFYYNSSQYRSSLLAHPDSDSFERVVRGGSFISDGFNCRSASRDGSRQSKKSSWHGFRIVLSR